MLVALITTTIARAEHFEGQFFAGDGDVEYLQLLDSSYRLFTPDAEWPSIAMLYMPSWNGFVEGPTWDAWWIQNSYGTTYSALPFYVEPYATWIQNSQDLWFSQMGDGHRRAPDQFVQVAGEAAAVPPDGNLCDAARLGWIYPKQGDGRVNIHDWPLGFDAAGLLLQAESLLISRETDAINHYLPMLERVANFLDSRRDPRNNLFLAGPAANLLAPSYAGYKKPDGAYDKAYLAEVSVTYIAALDRLIELEKMAGDDTRLRLYTQRRELAQQGLTAVTTPEGYFIRSLDPDGTKHGVFGADTHGYFESTPNHDAIAFRVISDVQARKIYKKINSIQELRPYGFIIPNYPGYDDMYENPAGLWSFGYWTNGGHWSTCEARMMLAYYRLGQYDDARRSIQQLLTLAPRWRMENNLIKFGSDLYQPNQPINIVYDTWGPPAAFIRGLFEYIYTAQGLTLIPHIPPTITALEQRFPIRLGENFFFLRIIGQGDITRVLLNGNDWSDFDKVSVRINDSVPELSSVTIFRGSAEKESRSFALDTPGDRSVPAHQASAMPELQARHDALARFALAVRNLGSHHAYEVSHAELAMRYIELISQRREVVAQGRVRRLPDAAQAAADQCYVDTAKKLCDGLEATIKSYERSDRPRQREIYQRWLKAQ